MKKIMFDLISHAMRYAFVFNRDFNINSDT